jgi:hypothetical protein
MKVQALQHVDPSQKETYQLPKENKFYMRGGKRALFSAKSEEKVLGRECLKN